MQKTFNVKKEDGSIDKIKVTVKRKTSVGNFVGFTVKVNEEEYFFNTLYQDEAMEKGYIKYIKNNR
jgi:beta-lactamase class D